MTNESRRPPASSGGSEPFFEPRPPFLQPYLRQTPVGRVEQFSRWLAAELGLPQNARVVLTEWVSFDGRDAPHLTILTVSTGAQRLQWSVTKRLDAIGRADLPSRLLPSMGGTPARERRARHRPMARLRASVSGSRP